MNTCSICLEEIKENHITKNLSCNHKYHFACFKKLVFNKGNMFVNCPLCRRININCELPSSNFKENIRLFSHCALSQGIKCNCITKKGTRCKRKALLMNYGMCGIHNKNILKNIHYELFNKWIYYLLQTRYDWVSFLHLIDFGKKIIINKISTNSGIENILHYLYKYYNINDNNYMDGIYDYYDLEPPPKSWIKYCKENKTII